MTPEQQQRYMAAQHRMQSAVRFEIDTLGMDEAGANPKHLRTGLNAVMSDLGFLSKLLIDKGIITDAEYFDALVEAAEAEADRMVKHVRQKCGLPDTVNFV